MMRPLRHLKLEQFDDAIELWFWFSTVKTLKDGPAPRPHPSGPARICETVDIVRPIQHLYDRKRLSEAHLHVLRIYGEQQRVPVRGHTEAEDRDAELWYEALEVLEPYWRSAGLLKERG